MKRTNNQPYYLLDLQMKNKVKNMRNSAIY